MKEERKDKEMKVSYF